MFKVGDKVMTLHGEGTIEGIEHFSRINGGTDRYSVRLKHSPFFYPVAGYWPDEIRKAVE